MAVDCGAGAGAGGFSGAYAALEDAEGDLLAGLEGAGDYLHEFNIGLVGEVGVEADLLADILPGAVVDVEALEVGGWRRLQARLRCRRR